MRTAVSAVQEGRRTEALQPSKSSKEMLPSRGLPQEPAQVVALDTHTTKPCVL